MRKTRLIGIVTAAFIVAGVTVAWVSSDSQLSITSVSAYAQSDGSAANQEITDSGSSAVKQAIANAGPSVVFVDVVSESDVSDYYSDLLDDPFFRQFFGDRLNDLQPQETESVGSGFAISYNGTTYVLTNEHVVDGATSITLTAHDGTSWSATVVGYDEQLDVAVLLPEGDASTLQTAVMGDSSAVELGDWSIAIGNPLGLSYTVTLGIISATDRDIAKPSGVGTYYNLLQTDAAINPGNSGGPLVDSAGEVIGINTLIARSSSTGVSVEGINFAIPINAVKDVLVQLIESGSVTRGWVGIAVADISPEIAESFNVDSDAVGALVAQVFPGDPGQEAGLEVGDIITRVNDDAIEDADEFVRQIGLVGANIDVDIEVLRGDESMTFTVTLGVRPSEEELEGYQGSATGETAASNLGMEVSSISPIVAEHLGLNSTDGVVIISVTAGSRAGKAGLAEGDVILEVDHQAVATVEEWSAAIADAEEGDEITLTVLRSGQLMYVTL